MFEALPIEQKTMGTVDRMWNDEITYERDSNPAPPAAFMVRPAARSRVPDRRSGRIGDRPARDVSKMTCYGCGKIGHLRADCRSRPIVTAPIGRAKDQKPATASSQPGPRISSGFIGLTEGNVPVAQSCNADGDAEEWVIDSGATHHLTPSYELLQDVRRLESPLTFSLADKGASFVAREVGSYVFETSAGQTVTLQEVYYVPQAKTSIVSVGTMTQKGWMFEMTASRARIYQHGADIDLQRSRGMWVARLHSPERSTGTIMEVVVASPLYEEHQRLGHLGRAKLLEIARAGGTNHDVKALEQDSFRLTDCVHCQAFRATRPPKKDVSPRGMLHVDLAGPFEKSAEMNDTMLVAVDDRTKARIVVPMEGKGRVLVEIKKIVARLDRQGPERVRIIRSDGGGEFGSNEAKAWYEELGLLHQISPRYSPELNGVAERNVRTIKEMIAAMISSSPIGHQYWDYAARYAAVILNKTSAGNDVNAWEVLTGRDASVQSIKRFGETCFVQVPQGTRDKSTFEVAKAEKGYILGQDEAVSGWIVLTESGKIRRSRDVKGLTGMIPTAYTEQVGAYIEPIDDTTDEVVDLNTNVREEPADDDDDEDVPEAVPTEDRPADRPADRQIDRPQASGVYRPGNWEYELGPERQVIPAGDTNLQRGDRVRRPPHRFEGGVHLVDGLEWHGQGARAAYLASEAAVFMAAELESDNPRTFKNAVAGEDRQKWIDAMNAEIENIETKGTWTEAVLPAGRSAIGCKWVYKKKRDQEGRVVKYKARLVAKGYSQVPGIDHEETYAPVGRSTSLRILLAAAASNDLETGQADVEGAYLNGVLEEEIYMEYPKGMTPKAGCNCLRLNKSLYGLKQSGRTWWIELGDGLEEQGFERTESDWGLYYRSATDTHETAIVLAYVDDIIVAAPSRSTITAIFEGMKKRWKITTLSDVSHILGLKVIRDRLTRTIHLSQPAYIESVVTRFPTVKPKTTPMGYRKTEDVSIDSDHDRPVGLTDYQAIVGSLLWIAGCTRPDVSFAAGYLARHTAAPRESHMNLALTCLAYLNSTKDAGLVLGGRKGIELEGWVDADHAGCTETRRSTTGYLFKLGDSPIVWRSTRQSTVSKSTVEAEYVAASEATAEARWLRALLSSIGYQQDGATVLWADNQGAIKLANNPSTHQRTKHIDIKYHFIRKAISDGEIRLCYVRTGQQQADMLTKGLPGPRHAENTHEVGLRRPGGAMVHVVSQKDADSDDGIKSKSRRIGTGKVSFERERRGDHDPARDESSAIAIQEISGFDGMTKREEGVVAKAHHHGSHATKHEGDNRTWRGETVRRRTNPSKAERREIEEPRELWTRRKGEDDALKLQLRRGFGVTA